APAAPAARTVAPVAPVHAAAAPVSARSGARSGVRVAHRATIALSASHAATGLIDGLVAIALVASLGFGLARLRGSRRVPRLA
ncbi:MAG TPA: hypothetical protein VE990_01070, partial [Acidimicrobiales bacterium]|nr:hypothetical protein [Acidimicrobiales bacterium]